MFYNPLLLLAAGPMAAGVLCLVFPDRLRLVTKALAFLVTAAALTGSVFVFMNKPLYWQYGPLRILAADNLSAFMAAAAAAFAFLITIYSFGFINRNFGRYFGYVLITLGSAFGVVYANDFLALIICWGMLAVTLFLLVSLQATDASSRAAKKALIIIGATDALMLFGLLLIWSMSKTTSMDNVHLELNGATQFVAYLAVMAAAFAKAGAMPFHSWLPDVAEAAPAPVAAYLPASTDKLLGIYLLVRFSLDIFKMNAISNTVLLVAGSATIVLAVIFALVQHDLKRLLGYHAVSQVGYMVIGIGTGSAIGIAGGLFHMLNHAIYKSCLFLSGGSVEKSAGTTDLARLGGLARYMPISFATFLVASLSISGIPPFNGFFSKWMIYQGIIESAGSKNPVWILCLVSAMFGSALTVASFMKLLHSVFLGRPSNYPARIREAGALMWFPSALLACACLVFGIFAFQIPLAIFVLPSIKVTAVYLGTWQPVASTVLIVIGLTAGILAYIIFKQGGFRTVATFVGGEDPASLDRVTGTEFYDTVRDLRGLEAIYKKEEAGTFDIYYLGRKSVYFFTNIFQKLHNGVLPTYLVWCLLGMLAIFLAVFFR